MSESNFYIFVQAQISGTGPSPVFPTGLSPTKQSEIQLDNVEQEGKVSTCIYHSY